MISRYACIFFIDVLFCDGAEFGTMVVQTSVFQAILDIVQSCLRIIVPFFIQRDVDDVHHTNPCVSERLIVLQIDECGSHEPCRCGAFDVRTKPFFGGT